MTAAPSNEDTCIVCGKSTEGPATFARVRHGDRSFAVCCPMCLQMFERASDRFARGDRPQSLLDELMEMLRWKAGRQ